MKVYIYNCDYLHSHITYMCICIPMYMTKFMDIYIQNCISYMLCNIILLCTVCSHRYRHTHTYTYTYSYIYIHT